MQRATFYVDFCFEDEDGGHLSGRYNFWIDFTDETYEELYQVWYAQNQELNNWSTNWDGHDKLCNTIWQVATEMLNKTVQKSMPELGAFTHYDTLWELSKETANEF